MTIETLIFDLSKKPFNPELNFAVAVEYEQLNQTASAVSFYLRTVEYSNKVNDPMVYASLLKMAHCFNDQTDRLHTVSNCLLQAIAYWPERPEGYFLLSQFHERQSQWQECYTHAEIGLHRATYPALPVDVSYYGAYCLEFEKAVSAYWVGRKKESVELLHKLASMDIAPEYKTTVQHNLDRINNVAV
jgi:hypothetical protein